MDTTTTGDETMTFDDLEFDTSPQSFNRSAKAKFPNGYGASVIIGEYTHGGPEGLYELAVLHGGALCYDTPITEDVLGHLTPDDVTEALGKIEALPVEGAS